MPVGEAGEKQNGVNLYTGKLSCIIYHQYVLMHP